MQRRRRVRSPLSPSAAPALLQLQSLGTRGRRLEHSAQDRGSLSLLPGAGIAKDEVVALALMTSRSCQTPC